jgi:hypothetical protein
MTEAIAKEGKAKVLDDIQKYYKKKAIANAKNQFGVAIKYTTAKPVKKETIYFERDKQFVELSKQKLGGGLNTINIKGLGSWQITAPLARNDSPASEVYNNKLNTMVAPYRTDENGMVTNSNENFNMYIEDRSKKKDKNGQYPLELNYKAWRASTGDLIPRKI